MFYSIIFPKLDRLHRIIKTLLIMKLNFYSRVIKSLVQVCLGNVYRGQFVTESVIWPRQL